MTDRLIDRHSRVLSRREFFMVVLRKCATDSAHDIRNLRRLDAVITHVSNKHLTYEFFIETLVSDLNCFPSSKQVK